MSKAHAKRGGFGGRSAPDAMRLVFVVVAGVAFGLVSTAPVAWAQSPAAPPQPQTAIVVDLPAPVLLQPDGTPAPGAAAAITQSTDAIARLSALPAGVVFALRVSPVFCDELSLTSTPAAVKLLSALRTLANRAQLVASPYAEERLPDEGAGTKPDLKLGRARLGACLDHDVAAVLVPPDLVLDPASWKAARERGFRVVLSRDSTEATNADASVLVPAFVVGPADVTAATARLAAYDAVAVVVDANRPESAAIVAKLASDSRRAVVRPDVLRAVAPNASVSFPDISSRPPASFQLALRRADIALALFRTYAIGASKLADVFRTAQARARSSAEFGGDWTVGRRRALALLRALHKQFDLITAVNGAITFTSRRGSLPVTVSNRAPYPVRVRVSVSSPKLRFPRGPSRVVTVRHPGDTITIDALAKSTGTFPTTVTVATPDGRLVFDRKQFTVRSTAANLPALVLTAGGAVFLVLWFGRRVGRRRVARSP